MNVINIFALYSRKYLPFGRNCESLLHTLRVVVLFPVCFWHVPAIFGAETGYADYHLKAAFILNFPNFIKWPEDSNDTGTTICTFGDNAVADSIETLLASAQMAERRARTAFFRDPDTKLHCDLVFLGVKAQSRIGEFNSSTPTAKTLIVSDIPNYAASGGMIELALVGTKIQVILNRAVVASAGFIVDSRLLQLTTDVSTVSPKVKE
jgi:hypothetical protein